MLTMQSILRRPAREYILLVLLWFGVQALPWIWLGHGRIFHFEIFQARKLLEYGLWARKGAMLIMPFHVGMLPNPAEHNYVNHNYPILWLFTLLYWLFGQVGVYVFVGMTGLAGLLMTYWILKQFFPRAISWFAAVLFACAHASVEFSVNPDMLAQGAIIWPLSCLVIIWLRQRGWPRGAWAGPALGLVVFFCGQINWFALSTVPALLVLCLPEEQSLAEAIRRPWSVPGWMPVLGGGIASLGLFLGQVIAYSPNLHDNAQYLGLQMGAGSFISSRLEKLPVLLLRMVLAGPALWFGTLVVLTQVRSVSPNRRLLASMLVYVVVLMAVMLTIPRLLFLNQHGFRYGVFPCTILTAFALSRLAARWFRAALVGIALTGLFFCYAKLHDYQVSSASMAMGRWLRANTAPDELVFSNLRYLSPPIKSWDREFLSNTTFVADRLVSFGVTDAARFSDAAKVYAQPMRNAAFLMESSQPMDTALLQKLESESQQVLATNLVVSEEGLRLFKAARESLWSLLGKRGPQYAPPAPMVAPVTNVFTVKLYRLPPDLVRQLNRNAGVDGRHRRRQRRRTSASSDSIRASGIRP
jgi:hypothetical protein